MLKISEVIAVAALVSMVLVVGVSRILLQMSWYLPSAELHSFKHSSLSFSRLEWQSLRSFLKNIKNHS